MERLTVYPYLVESLAILLVAGIGLLILHRQWKLVLLSGLFCIPNAVLSAIHVPWFWNPRVIANCFVIPEDLVWLFAAGMLAWLAASFSFAARLTWRSRPWAMIARYVGCLALESLFLGSALFVCPERVMVMYPTLAAMLLMAAVLACQRRDALPLALAGAFGYTLLHVLDLSAFLCIWPETAAYWNPAAQLPFSVFGIPTFEVIFAMAFGFLWPLVVAFVCDVRITETSHDSGRPKIQRFCSNRRCGCTPS